MHEYGLHAGMQPVARIIHKRIECAGLIAALFEML